MSLKLRFFFESRQAVSLLIVGCVCVACLTADYYYGRFVADLYAQEVATRPAAGGQRSAAVFEQERFLGAVIVKRNIDYFVRRTSQADALVLDANGVIVLARLPSKPAQPVPVGRLTIFINWLRQPRP